MVQSPSWVANWFAVSQEIPRISLNPNVHYRTRNSPPTVPILTPFQIRYGKGKGKAIPLRSEQALRVPGIWGLKSSRQSAHECGKYVSLTHRPPLPPQEIFLVLISVRGWFDPRTTVRPAGICQWKIPATWKGIELATSRHVAQCT